MNVPALVVIVLPSLLLRSLTVSATPLIKMLLHKTGNIDSIVDNATRTRPKIKIQNKFSGPIASACIGEFSDDF